MKILILCFYIACVPLSYGLELAKSLPEHIIYCKPRSKKFAEPEKSTTLPEKQVSCNLRDKKIKVTKSDNFLKSHITNIKKFYESLDNTIQQVTDKNPTPSQIAKIMFAISNLINNIDAISDSNHLDKVMDVISESDDTEPANDIYELLCGVKNFLHIFSLSFIEDTVTELPVKNEFDKKIESEWYKNGLTSLTKCIHIVERFVELESCREDIMSFFPLVQKTYKQISDIISKMVTSDSTTFIKEIEEFIDSVQEFKGVLKQIETNTCLVSRKSITQAQEIVSLAKGLHTYFFDLSTKLKEILEEIKVDQEEKGSATIQYHTCKSDGYIQDVIHDIFLCKYNKIFYKQMNNEVSKLLTLIKSLEEIKE